MTSRRRAVLAIAVPVLVPPVVVALARDGRWPAALAVGALFVVFVAVELVRSREWVR